MRKAICRYLKASGDRCTAPVVDPEADTLLCAGHIAGAIGAVETARRAVFSADVRESSLRMAQDRAARDDQAQRSAVVYYARCWGLIKIGTTLDITARMRDLKATELLATEPGYFDVETRRHQQFAHLRVRGEYFTPAPVLMSHVEEIRAQHGPPISTTEGQLSLGGGRRPRASGEAVDAAGLGAARLVAAIRHR